MTGKCPKCEKSPTFGVNLQAVDIKGSDGRTWHGVAYVCPNLSCQTILGVGMDSSRPRDGYCERGSEGTSRRELKHVIARGLRASMFSIPPA